MSRGDVLIAAFDQFDPDLIEPELRMEIGEFTNFLHGTLPTGSREEKLAFLAGMLLGPSTRQVLECKLEGEPEQIDFFFSVVVQLVAKGVSGV